MVSLHSALRDNKIIGILNEEFKGVTFIALLALSTILSSVFSLELLHYTLCCAVAVFIMLFCDDLSPLIPITAFFYFSPSVANNPGQNPDSIYFPEHGLIYIIILIVLFLAVFIYRIITDAIENPVKVRLPSLTFGFIALGAAYFLGGIGYEEYTPDTIFFAFIQIASLTLLYFLFVTVIDWKRVKKEYFAWICFFGGIIIFYEILYSYAVGDFIADGEINRGLYTGWGMYNNVGSALAVFLPSAFYLAAKKRCGWIFAISALVLLAGIALTQSRTSIAVGAVVYFLSSIACFFASKGKKKISNGIAILLTYAIIAAVVLNNVDNFRELLESLLNFEEDGSSRVKTWEKGLALFKEYPVFGTGFYSCKDYKWGGVYTFIPPRWHNTYVQLLASCGIVGLVAYAFHRVQTLVVLFKKPSFEKLFISLCILSLVGTSILDCHFFNIGPGLIYSVLLAFAERMDECE